VRAYRPYCIGNEAENDVHGEGRMLPEVGDK